jgi:hypothetical protein
VEVDVARESRESMKIENARQTEIPMTNLDGVTNDRMMSKRLTWQRFKISTLSRFKM